MDDTHGEIAWTELMTGDAAAARKFYGRLCGWSFDAMGEGSSYFIAKKNGKPVAGIFGLGAPTAGTPVRWFTYLSVRDVDASVAEARAAGGKVHREPWDIPGVGRIAIIEDPGGAALGLMTPEGREDWGRTPD